MRLFFYVYADDVKASQVVTPGSAPGTTEKVKEKRGCKRVRTREGKPGRALVLYCWVHAGAGNATAGSYGAGGHA